MIYGIGTDLVDLDRIRKMKSLSSFARKILGIQELEHYDLDEIDYEDYYDTLKL